MPWSMRAVDVTKINLGSPEIMEKLGQHYLTISRERVETDGLGSDGEPMADYSESYAKARDRAGRETDHRSLSFTGEMLTSRLVTDVTDTSCRVTFADAEADKAQSNEERTPFVKPTPDERQQLKDLARSLFKDHIRRQRAALVKE